ncbi:MAG: L-fuculose kinase [Pseudomonadota bacterium]
MTDQIPAPRSIVALDIGSTNINVVHFSSELEVLDSQSTSTLRHQSPPYLSLDVEQAVDFSLQSIRAFDRTVPVDAIVPCTHGSALALIDEHGDLVFPVMSYLAAVPDDIAVAYAAIEPDFDEVLAPTNPGALTLGRQLLWLETAFPEQFSRVRHILPYAQYLAYRLSGVLSCEVTSLGAQTHLWAHRHGDYSALAKQRGWASKMPPLRMAGDTLGAQHLIDINGRGLVLCGIHDSSASFLQFANHEPLVLLSTGTWIIAFDSAADLDLLDATRDQVANARVDGTALSCARFMGGEEYGLVSGMDNRATATMLDVQSLISAGTMALPSFTDSGGPVLGTGGQGTIVGPSPSTDGERASLATLYTALMTAIMLEHLGDTRRVVVDGVFAGNKPYLALLSALLPHREVLRAAGPAGSARGAASLALPAGQSVIAIESAPTQHYSELDLYYAAWQDRSRKGRQ